MPPKSRSPSHGTEWQCARCTFINKPHRVTCHLCKAHKKTRPTSDSRSTSRESRKRCASPSELAILNSQASDDGGSLARSRRRKERSVSSCSGSLVRQTSSNSELASQPVVPETGSSKNVGTGNVVGRELHVTSPSHKSEVLAANIEKDSYQSPAAHERPPPAFEGFVSGLGKKIVCSEASLRKARELLGMSGDGDDAPDNGTPAISADEPHADPPQPSLVKAMGEEGPSTPAPPFPGGFVTGAGKAIAVSEEALQRARARFGDLDGGSAGGGPTTLSPAIKLQANAEGHQLISSPKHTSTPPATSTSTPVLRTSGGAKLGGIPRSSGGIGLRSAGTSSSMSGRSKFNPPKLFVSPAVAATTTPRNAMASAGVGLARPLFNTPRASNESRRARSGGRGSTTEEPPAPLLRTIVLPFAKLLPGCSSVAVPTTFIKLTHSCGGVAVPMSVTDQFSFPVAAASQELRELMGCVHDDDHTQGTLLEARHFRHALITLGALQRGCTMEWVDAQLRLVTWQLVNVAAGFFGGSDNNGSGGGASAASSAAQDVLSPLHVLANLLCRYNVEYVSGCRSALRAIFEKDASPSASLVLQITKQLDATVMHRLVLQVTDGWYVANASLDVELSRRFREGEFAVGSRLLTCGATWVLVTASHPLEAPEEGVHAELHSNGTFLATPSARLGFATAEPAGASEATTDHSKRRHRARAVIIVPTVRIANIVTTGGAIPSIVATVVRVLPPFFVENVKGRRVFRNALAESAAAAAFERICEDAYERELAKAGREAAADLIRAQYQRDCSAVRTIVLADDSGVCLVQVWGRGGAEGRGGHVEGGDESTSAPLQEGSVIRVFNTVPAKYESLPAPFSGARMVYARPSLTHVVLTPQELAACNPVTLAQHQQRAAAFAPSSQTLREIIEPSDDAPSANSRLIDIAVVVMRHVSISEVRAQLLFCDASRNLFGVLHVLTSAGNREFALPRVAKGDIVFVSGASLSSVDRSGAFDVAHFTVTEYTSILPRSLSRVAATALESLRAQDLVWAPYLHDDFIETFPRDISIGNNACTSVTEWNNDSRNAADVKDILRGTVRGDEYELRSSGGLLPLPQAAAFGSSTANGEPSRIRPKRTMFSSSATLNGTSISRQPPPPVNGVAPLDSGLRNGSTSRSPPLAAPESLKRLHEDELQSGKVIDAVQHLFGNVLPTTLRVVYPTEFMLVESSEALACASNVEESGGASGADPHSGAGDGAAPGDAAAAIEIHGTFNIGAGGLRNVVFHGAELLALVGDLANISNAAAADDALDLALARGHRLRGLPPQQQWGLFLMNSVVVPRSVFDKAAAAGATDSPGGFSATAQLQSVARWNAETVPTDHVLWWLSEEYAEVQRAIQVALAARLLKLSVAPQGSVTRIFSVATGLSIDALCAE